jgi:hypothetical protein
MLFKDELAKNDGHNKGGTMTAFKVKCLFK